MKLANVTYKGVNRLAVQRDSALHLVDRKMGQSTDDIIEVGAEAIISALGAAEKVSETDVTFRPAITRPSKIFCIGLNYRQHAIETGLPFPEVPLVFSKFNNALAASGEVVKLPSAANQVDYEAELAVIIGKRAHQVTEEAALDYVYGYTNANDISARDLQLRTNQWLLGKSCDGFMPIGPYLVTRDEISNPDALSIRLIRNNTIVQDSNTKDMIFSTREIIAYLSTVWTLEPGDVILTGTPSGVVLGMPEGQKDWLKSGEITIVEIEGLGRLFNTFK